MSSLHTDTSIPNKAAILILADLFRFQNLEGDKPSWIPRRNTKVLQALMEAAAPRPRGESAQILDHQALGWSEDTFRTTFGVEATAQSWSEHTNAALPPVLSDKIAELIDGRVVVGFELPPSLWDLAKKHARCVLDLAIHPVRFADELLFYGRAHGLDLAEVVSAELTEARLRWEAVALRARLNVEAGAEPPRTDALLALQVGVDRALLDASGLASPLDHMAKIGEVAAAHARLQVKPHPYAPIGVALALALVRIPNLFFTARNVYELLARGEIASVWGLSTSVLHEAGYFGIEAHALRPDLSFGLPVHADLHPVTLGELIGPVGRALASLADGAALSATAVATVEPRNPILRQLFGQTWAHGEYFPEQPPVNTIPAVRSLFSDPHFDNSRVYGWGPPEPWGSWSIGPIGVVNLAWDESYGDSIFVLAEAWAYAGFPTQRKQIEIWSLGACLGQFDVTDVSVGPTPLIFEVPKPRHGTIAQIAFLNPEPLRPVDVGESDDTRELGLGLVSLRVIPGR